MCNQTLNILVELNLASYLCTMVNPSEKLDDMLSNYLSKGNLTGDSKYVLKHIEKESKTMPIIDAVRVAYVAYKLTRNLNETKPRDTYIPG